MVAIPVFRSRVAPVLNWCSKIVIVPEDAADGTSGQEVVLPDMNVFDRLRVLREEGVRTVICGALTPELLQYGEELGLHIIHGVAGDIDEVLKAHREEQLAQPHFWLPGCRGRRQYRKGGACQEGSKEQLDGAGQSQKNDRGRGGSVAGGRRKKESAANAEGGLPAGGRRAGPGGFCICPRCGTKTPHERGIPCAQNFCPQCDQPMSRG
jgi:predicted Fe-Mo cluster-binding NifX family protein